MRKAAATKMFMVIIFTFSVIITYGQETKKLYDPSLDGMKQIKDATSLAASSGKHVLIQYGGNWCSWCIRFDAFCKADTAIMNVINKNYVPVKLNYDPSNKNEA